METGHRRIPRRWIALLVLLGLPVVVAGGLGPNLSFTLRRFIESPALISSLLSLDVLFNILVAATCLYVSDYIWTRRGRRIPFILVSWIGIAVCLVGIPVAGTAAGVVSLMVLYMVFMDVSATLNTLVMEIVPPEQRMWYSVWSQWAFNLLNLLMWLMINGRFDDTLHAGAFVISGEHSIYGFAAAGFLAGAIFIGLFVRERKPAVIPAFPAGGFLKGTVRALVRERGLWPVYLLAFSHTLVQTGLGAVDGLLITEQWGYSKQDMATNVFAGGLLNIALLPLLGWGLNRVSRITGFAIGVAVTLGLKIAYYLFVQFALPDHRPDITHMILFGYPISLGSSSLSIVSLPLIFDYIPRDQMGTAQAGLNVVRNLTRLVTLNGVGLWVTAYSAMVGRTAGYDYFSGYLFMILMEIVGAVFLLYFILQVRRGAIRAVGLGDPVRGEGA